MYRVFVGILFLLNSCSPKESAYYETGVVDEESGADLVIFKFKAKSFTSKHSLWKLNAQKAYLFQKKNQTIVKNLKIESFYQKEKTTVVADSGILNSKEKNIKLYGGVIVTNAEGKVLKTEKLIWQEESGQISTDSPVTIYLGKNNLIKAKGLTTDSRLRNIRLFQSSGFHSPLLFKQNE